MKYTRPTLFCRKSSTNVASECCRGACVGLHNTHGGCCAAIRGAGPAPWVLGRMAVLCRATVMGRMAVLVARGGGASSHVRSCDAGAGQAGVGFCRAPCGREHWIVPASCWLQWSHPRPRWRLRHPYQRADTASASARAHLQRRRGALAVCGSHKVSCAPCIKNNKTYNVGKIAFLHIHCPASVAS